MYLSLWVLLKLFLYLWFSSVCLQYAQMWVLECLFCLGFVELLSYVNLCALFSLLYFLYSNYMYVRTLDTLPQVTEVLGFLNLSSSSLSLDNAIFFCVHRTSLLLCPESPSRNIIEWYIISNDVSFQTLHFSDLKFSFCYFGIVAVSLLRFPVCSSVTPIFSFKYLNIVIWLLNLYLLSWL